MSHPGYSVYNEKCPSHNVLEGISDKWSILVISLLSQKIYRFGELKREIGGISPKMLTQTLLKLERYGFVQRQSYPVLPMKVEYSLTRLGKELSAILVLLTRWTETNMDKIINAEKTFCEQKLGCHARFIETI
ncbi:TPA: winged helix-turn-helix transcriptional regulator [Legionella pneumophila]|uniref:winged helix-turn-helix transcriptional regulator n=1 Tax=Legionella pneumophila TaxID=446 RepID=UPI00026D95F5|nr:helix-turn-helix domain-containing protein [Legionella pneumophila]ANH11889.1 HxlR family transcriptional regulator [Legionella pneumophila]ANH14857.1 HxlR family transcriptional regulator [Legionella pneumophila]ANH17823.1 HxlR family transcriptional regulator [Legionella pneumophila]APX18704.1 HxlR family transcriptional regulator [Legionella pneumophila]AQL10883.1 HxlR family transcriptional regulator [Legionella pneumophila]